MKRFFAKLFWRGNSRSGLLFGVLLNTLTWTLAIYPVLLGAINGLGTDFLRHYRWSPYAKIACTALAIGALLALYAAILGALFCNDLMKAKLRAWQSLKCGTAASGTRRFRLIQKTVAVLCVLPPVMAIVFLVCAMRSANKKAIVFSCVFVGGNVLCALFALTELFAHSVAWLEATLLLFVAGLVFAAYAFDGFPRTRRWGYASAIFLVALVLIGETTNALLNRAVDKRLAALVESGVSKAHYENFMDRWTECIAANRTLIFRNTRYRICRNGN